MSAAESRWVCTGCSYIYDPAEGDPEAGVEPGTRFDDLPQDWVCPQCYLSKADFDPLD